MQCPHCPQAARSLLAIADRTPAIKLIVIDGVLFAEEAKTDGIRMVPTLIMDEHLRWSGRIDPQEVLRQCRQRDPITLSAASLRQILQAGDAERAADVMAARGQIFPALIVLLLDPQWSVRLGAMVAVEYLIEQAPELTAMLIDPLWEKFAAAPEQVQGDIVQVLGQIPDKKAKELLERIAAGDYAPSVREAATEELQL